MGHNIPGDRRTGELLLPRTSDSWLLGYMLFWDPISTCWEGGGVWDMWVGGVPIPCPGPMWGAGPPGPMCGIIRLG